MKRATFRIVCTVDDHVDKQEAQRLMRSCVDRWPNDLIDAHIVCTQLDEVEAFWVIKSNQANEYWLNGKWVSAEGECYDSNGIYDDQDKAKVIALPPSGEWKQI